MVLNKHIKENFYQIVDKFYLPARSSDIIKERGPQFLFRELEERRLIDFKIGNISGLEPLIQAIPDKNSFVKIEFFSLVDDLEISKELDFNEKRDNRITDFAPLVRNFSYSYFNKIITLLYL